MTCPLELAKDWAPGRAYTLHQGVAPLLVSVPHAGRELPPALLSRLVPRAHEVEDTDWHVDRIYKFVQDLGASFLVPRFSRYLVDLNRPPENIPMYPGANNTGICPTTFFDGTPLYRAGQMPTDHDVNERIRDYWKPYHDAITAEMVRLHSHHGYVVLWDGHSICSEVPWLFEGRLPDLNLGTVDATSCSPSLRSLCAEVLAGQRQLSSAIDGRFKGGHITRFYGRPEQGWHAIQMEMTWSSYLDESRPQHWNPARAEPTRSVLQTLIENILDWHPPSIEILDDAIRAPGIK